MPAHEDVVRCRRHWMPRIAIASESTHPHVAVPSRAGGPPGAPMQPRTAGSRTETIAFLLRTSGTSAQPRWVALSDRSVVATLQSHLPHLGIDGAGTLCLLPWHHAFGLVLGLLPGLLRANGAMPL
ncbi:MAG: hypothetical protein U5K74_04150, partial [Gemmatimonadaceae bacterium]|nr:hypothetical protein [Gemmatimonadaceae bacterium]